MSPAQPNQKSSPSVSDAGENASSASTRIRSLSADASSSRSCAVREASASVSNRCNTDRSGSTTDADHIPPRKSRTTVYYYVNFTVGDVSALCPDYVSSETSRRSHSPLGVLQSTSNARQSWENQLVPEPFLRLLKLFPFLRPEENQLLDYCTWASDDRNHDFRLMSPRQPRNMQS